MVPSRKILNAVPVFWAVVIILLDYLLPDRLEPRLVFEPRFLLPILNTVFITFASFTVAYLSARSYLASGLVRLLFMGCGTVSFGLGSLIAGWAIETGRPNFVVTVFNWGALFGGVFHLLGAVATSTGESVQSRASDRMKEIMFAYLGVFALVLLPALASFSGVFPVFFIQGVGPTPLRQIVLGSATALFGISSLIFLILYYERKEPFFYWYALGLIFISVGLFGVFITREVGGPIGWLGRTAQYLGGICFFSAVIIAFKRARTGNVDTGRIFSNLFRQPGELYKTLVQAVTDAIVVLDHQRKVLLWNPAAERMFGYRADEALGLSLSDLIAPGESFDEFARVLQAFPDTGSQPARQIEMEAKAGDGRSIPVEVSVSGTTDSGRPMVTVVLRDITERKQAEEAVQNACKLSERHLAQLNALVNQMTEGLVIFDPHGNLLDMNPAALAIHGLKEFEIPGQNLQKLEELFELSDLQGRPLPPEEWPIGRVLRGETFNSYEVRVRRRDTGKSWIGSYGGTPIRDQEGRLLMAILTLRDVTEQKSAEQALSDSEERFRRLAEAIPQLVLAADAEGKSIYLNRRFVEYAGREILTPEERLRIIHPEDLPHVMERWQEAVNNTGEFQSEHRLRRYDGEYHWFLARAILMRDAQNRITGWFSTATDIHELKQTQDALRKARDELELRVRERTAELEQSNKELQDFAYIASHDLQEPLRKIQTFGGLLKDKYSEDLEGSALDYLTRMQDAAGRMQNLLEALLDYSRVSTRAKPFTRVDINRVVKEAVSNLSLLLEETKGEVIVGRLPTLEADQVQMVQLFQNLIQNAVKFHKEDTAPVVKIYASRSSEAAEKESWDLFIEDNGIGFEEKYLKQIFQPFERLHGRDTYEGAGIGLSICRKIVDRHRGGITARSVPGEGSTFIVTLPEKQN